MWRGPQARPEPYQGRPAGTRRPKAQPVDKIRTAEYLRSAHSAADFLRDGRPEIAFVGRSNVGKSSLLNALLGRRGLARVSRTPGRTQAVNYFLIDGRLYFVDLPGYGYAKTSQQNRSRWAQLMESYFDQALPAATVVVLVDAKVGGTPLDEEALGYLTSKGAEPVVVATKIDKVPRSRRHASLATVRRRLALSAETPVIPFSASTGEGLRELWKELSSRLETESRSTVHNA
jgi:GTP-binding protein